MPDLVGRTLGKYRIVARLGRGGMAEVYKAYHASLDRYVAIKVLYSDLAGEAASIARFQREAKAVAALRHPNIVQVFDFDVQDDMYYMAMEFVNGPTLKRELEERSLQGRLFTLDETVRIMVALCQAIDYAHSRGMVHRDLKPANFILTNDGQILVLDFGIAKMVNTTKFTATGSVMGTPTYMSPEQGQGERGDERSDIYSLGVVLYHMATGKLPFDADTPFAVILKHISAPLPMPSTVNPDIPDSLERVILKALSKEPDERFQTGAEFADALREAAGIAANDNLTKNPVETIALPPEVAHALAQSEPAVESAPATGSTQAMIPCPVCGQDTLADSKFCTSCGVSLTTLNMPPQPATPTIPPPQENNLLLLGLGMGGVAAVLLALVVAVGGLIYFTNRSQDAPAPQAAAQIVPSHTPTHTPAPTPTDTPQPATATPTPSPSPTAQTVSSDALPTATPTPTFTPTNTPTPAPTPTPTPLGQNCNREAGGTFNSLWQSYRHIIGCPLAPQQTLAFMAEEIFQGGHMFWREDLDEVYVVFDRLANGTDLFQGSWQTNPAWKWDGSFPNGTGASPPPGLVEPIRGFGWVWRNQMNGADGPLGWALDGEHGFDALGQVQMFEQGLMFKGSAPKVYLLLYDGRFFAQ